MLSWVGLFEILNNFEQLFRYFEQSGDNHQSIYIFSFFLDISIGDIRREWEVSTAKGLGESD